MKGRQQRAYSGRPSVLRLRRMCRGARPSLRRTHQPGNSGRRALRKASGCPGSSTSGPASQPLWPRLASLFPTSTQSSRWSSNTLGKLSQAKAPYKQKALLLCWASAVRSRLRGTGKVTNLIQIQIPPSGRGRSAMAHRHRTARQKDRCIKFGPDGKISLALFPGCRGGVWLWGPRPGAPRTQERLPL